MKFKKRRSKTNWNNIFNTSQLTDSFVFMWYITVGWLRLHTLGEAPSTQMWTHTHTRLHKHCGIKIHTRFYEHWDLFLGNLAFWHLPIHPLEFIACPQYLFHQQFSLISTIMWLILVLVISHLYYKIAQSFVSLAVVLSVLTHIIGWDFMTTLLSCHSFSFSAK